MPQQVQRGAARDRDLGMRRIRRITWRTGLAAGAVATVLAVALGQQAAASTTVLRHHDEHGSIVIPAQPPQPSGGSGLVTSGAS